MLERAKQVTRRGKGTYIEYARFADDLVILVDARADEDDELVKVRRIEPTDGLSNMPHTSHALGLPDLLYILRDWYGTTPACYAVMPKGYDFSIGEVVSERAQLAAAEARVRIAAILESAFQASL